MQAIRKAILAGAVALCGRALGGGSETNGGTSAPSPLNGALERVWTTSFDARVTPQFQLYLGGLYDPSPSAQARWTNAVSNLFRRNDRLSLTAFQATSATAGHTNWWAGLNYQFRAGRTKGWTWDATTGVERWRFPSVLKGTQDWAASWNLAARRPVRRMTWTAMVDGRTTFASNVPLGSIAAFSFTTLQPLWKGEKNSVTLQHGPMYIQSWGLFGFNGPRAFRYTATVAFNTPSWSVDAGIRPQMGLAPRVPDHCYWSFGMTWYHSKVIRRRG